MSTGRPRRHGTRWVMFGTVGAIGWVLQLTLLWLLTQIAGVHYLIATCVAVEAAIAHNFYWHQRWTWADRPGGTAVMILERLLRFNLTNGLVSLVGNVVLTGALVQLGQMNPLMANVIGVAACAAANFVLSDRVVFAAALSLAFVLTGGSWEARAADLDPAASQAFDRYTRLAESRMDAERAGKAPFLWVDRQPESQRKGTYARLRRNDIVISRMQIRHGEAAIRFPGAICHHWIGTALIDGVSLSRAVDLMQGYDNYPGIYRPQIRKSRVIARRDNQFTVYLQLFMKKVVTVVMNSELVVDYLPISASRIQVRSHSTKVAEVTKPDTPAEREEAAGHDSGYLWRFNNYCALEERSEGTYLQCESISLSRDIPFGLGWLIGPFVNDVPKESLEATLTAMRRSLKAQ